MDPALLAELRADSWLRLSQLARRSRLAPEEARELLVLYRRASKDLSALTTTAPDSEITARLSTIVHRARTHLSGQPRSASSALLRFFVRSLPAALYRLRWHLLAANIAFYGIAVISALWALHTPGALDALMPPEMQEQYARRDFAEYYHEHAHSVFAMGVWTNNAWIAVQWVALGITGVYVVFGLIANAANVGVAAAMMYAYDQEGVFYSYILPHGIPEISCILIAAAAGFRIFLSWIVPREMTRGESLAKEARSTITVAGGLVVFLFLSGLVEGFITPSALPLAVRLGVGIALTLAILAYAVVLGRPVVLEGGDGDVDEHSAGYRSLAAA